MRFATTLGLLLSTGLCAQSLLPKQVIAGPGDSGDGGPAASAWLRYPEATASDASGNLYISDAVCGCIRRVGPDGAIATVAGGGGMRAADGVPAVGAEVGSIYGLAVAADGSLYFSSTNNRVFTVDGAGLLRVVAGTGAAGFGGDGGPATQATLNLPWSIAFGPGGVLFIGDRNNYRVRQVSPDGVITTVAGNGTLGRGGDGGPALQAQLQFLYDLAVDAAGVLYLNDGCRIRKISADGVIQTIAGGAVCGYSAADGPAASTLIESNSGIAVDSAANIYIAEPSRRVRMIDGAGMISTIAGDGGYGVPDDGAPARRAQFGFPYRVSLDAAGDLYVSDLYNKSVYQIDTGGIVHVAAGSAGPADGVPALAGRLNSPSVAVSDAQGNIYVADAWAARVRKIAPDGSISTVAGKGNHGDFGDGEGGPGAADRIAPPQSLAVDAAGNLFIGTSNGNLLTGIGGIHFGVLKLSADGTLTTIAGGATGYSGDGGPAIKAGISGAAGLAFDAAGNLYLSDWGNHAIRRITPDGIISTIAGGNRAGFGGDGGPAAKALLNDPQGVAFDSQGNLLIADFGNHRIRRISTDGTITTIAGDGAAGLAGDGGPAARASMSPSSVAADAFGNIYIADSSNNRVRKISTDGIIRSIAIAGSVSHLSLAADGGLLLTEGVWGMVSRLAP